MIFSEFIRENSGDYHCSLRNNSEERGSRLLRGGSLKAHVRENSLFFRTYLLAPWSRVLLEKLTSKLCS